MRISLRHRVTAVRHLKSPDLHAAELHIPALILQRDGSALQRALVRIDGLRAVQHDDDVVAAHGDFVVFHLPSALTIAIGGA